MSGKWQEIEKERGKPIREVLEDEYQRHKTQSRVAAALGITQGTLSYWLLKLNLEQATVLRERQVG